MPDRLRYLGQAERTSIPTFSRRTESKAERDKFYGSKRWRELRLAYLRANPLCVACLKFDLVVEADTVHHLKERLEAPELAYDWSNLEASCGPCHTQRHKLKKAQNANGYDGDLPGTLKGPEA